MTTFGPRAISTLAVAAGLALAAAGSASADPTPWTASVGHVDLVEIECVDDDLVAQVHNDTDDGPLHPTQAELDVGTFLVLSHAWNGPVAIIPQAQDNTLLWFGFANHHEEEEQEEEEECGLDPVPNVTYTLTGVVVDGDVKAYDESSLTPTTPVFDSTAVGPYGSIALGDGGHQHLRWEFSDPGDYYLTFELSASVPIANDEITVHIEVEAP